MKVEFKTSCAVGAARYKSGAVADIEDTEADKLIDSGFAVPVDVKAKTEDRSIGLDENKPRTRVKKNAS